MNIKELNIYLRSLPDELLEEAAEIISETATEYFKQAFSEKAFDGNPWAAPLRPRGNGSLLVDSGALVNSVRPVAVSRERVVIAAGNGKVGYAAAHNEGVHGAVAIPAHRRRTRHGEADVRAHTRQANLPQRQFMGDADELNTAIFNRIEGYVESKLR